MRDIDIRRALRLKMEELHPCRLETRIVEELSICQGVARVDLAVLNGSIHGYEIKSEKDTLVRLKSQAGYYSQALEYMTIVAAPQHLPKISELVPGWWGIRSAADRDGVVELIELQAPKRNPTLTALALAQFLWRDEAMDVLAKYGFASGLSGKSRHHVWFRLTTAFETEELCAITRICLKARRTEWLAL